MTMTFCEWLRATGHTHNGLSARDLYRLWKGQQS